MFCAVTWLNPAIPLVSQGVGGARTVLLRYATPLVQSGWGSNTTLQKSSCASLLTVHYLFAECVYTHACRKKYFLKNEDLDEYSKTNSLLLENIYAQVRYCVLCMIKVQCVVEKPL